MPAAQNRGRLCVTSQRNKKTSRKSGRLCCKKILFVQFYKQIFHIGKPHYHHNFVAVAVHFTRAFRFAGFFVTAGAFMLILQFQVQIVEKLAYVVKQRKLPVKLGIVVSFTENSRVDSV